MKEKQPTIETKNLKAVTVNASSLVVASAAPNSSDPIQEGMLSSLERIDKNTAILPGILTGKAAGITKEPPHTEGKIKRVLPPRDPATGRFVSNKAVAEASQTVSSPTPETVKTSSSQQESTQYSDHSFVLPQLPDIAVASPAKALPALSEKEPGTESETDSSPKVAAIAPDVTADPERATTEPEAGNSGSQQAQEASRQEKRDKSFLDSLKTWATGAAGKGYASLTGKTDELSKNEDLNDAVGSASGGAIYGAAKELAELTGQAKDSTLMQKAGEYGKRGWNRLKGKESEPEPEKKKTTAKGPMRDPETGKFLSKEERKKIEAQASVTSAGSINTDLVEGNEQISDALGNAEKENYNRHKELVAAVKGISVSAGSESGGLLDSLFDSISGGRDKGTKAAGAGATGGIFSKISKGAKGLGRIAGKAAAPLAALTAGGFKYAEIKDDDSLSDGQKSVQVGSTATGALGGAAAGAAAGAALGSVVPILGTAVGGILGAVIGGIGGEKLGEMAGEAISDKMSGKEPPTPIENAVQTEAVPVMQSASVETASTVSPEASLQTVKSEQIITPKPEQPKPIPKPPLKEAAGAKVPGQQANIPAFDEYKLTNALTKALSQSNQQMQYPAVVPAQSEIQMDFDDVTLTLMAYDRI